MTMIRVFTYSDQGLDLCCFCCHRMLRGDSSCDILKNPYRKILNHREDNNTWLSVDRFHPMPTCNKLILIIFLIVMVELELILFILTQGAIDIHYFSSVEAA